MTIRRLSINRYKTLVGFELEPGRLLFLTGDLGAGKTTVLEALRFFRRFLLRRQGLDELLGPTTLSRWDAGTTQSFGIAIEDTCGLLEYSLIVDYGNGCSLPFLTRERLTCDGTLLVETSGRTVRALRGGELVEVALERSPIHSAIPHLAQNGEKGPIERFAAKAADLFVLQLQPHVMQDIAVVENRYPSATMFNFAPWWRHLVQEEPDVTGLIMEELRSIFHDFDVLRLVKTDGRERQLVAKFTSALHDGSIDSSSYRFSELSDGQRSLIALLSLLHVGVTEGAVLCIDAPERYLTSCSLEHWLRAVDTKTSEGRFQVIIACQYPELLNAIDAVHGVWLERAPSGPTRVVALAEEAGRLSIAEAVALRGR